jgi:hypothetical protein
MRTFGTGGINTDVNEKERGLVAGVSDSLGIHVFLSTAPMALSPRAAHSSGRLIQVVLGWTLQHEFSERGSVKNTDFAVLLFSRVDLHDAQKIVYDRLRNGGVCRTCGLFLDACF